MAGMFYSLQEIADKLGSSIEEAEALAKEHKLREFRDGQRVLFKVSDVDPIIAESSSGEPMGLSIDDDLAEISESLSLEPESDDEEVSLVAEEPEEDFSLELEDDDDELFQSDDASEDEISLEIEPVEEPAAVEEPSGVEEEIALEADDDTLQLAPDDDTLQLASESDTLGLASESDTMGLASETNVLGISGADSVGDLLSGESEFDLGPIDTGAEAVSEDSINSLLSDDDFSDEAGPALDENKTASAADLISDLTSADTRGATTGINVLGESDADYELSADSKADTQDADLEDEFGDLDEDMNLDTVGSGSGLLDLSLQADDTSLGAVLDDILPAAGEEEASMPSGDDFGVADDEAIFDEVPANGGGAVSVGSGGGAAAAVGRYVEIPADASSNAFGISLLFPIAAIVFALIVVLNFAMYGSAPSFMGMVEGYLMYVVIGLSVASLLVVGVGAIAGGGSGEPKAKKAKKEKAPKAPKAKKEKAPKKKKEKKKK